MKPLFAVTPALLLAGALSAAPVSAQTMAQPYAGSTTAPYDGQNGSTLQTSHASLPQGPYLNECKEVRMLEGTLTAFCPRGDGTWQTTQLVGADRCAGKVQNAGGDLVCRMQPQVGSTVPPQSYVSSAGGSYGTPAAPPAYAPAAPTATGPYPPAYPPAPGPAYAAPAYGYGGYAGTYNPYAVSPDQYVAPSAGRTAQPWGY